MPFKDDLIATAPREVSGRRTINRFDYQLCWSICQLIELHQSHQDYALVLEFHDDVLVLDSASNPDSAQFFQIKTGTGDQWRRSEITTADSSGLSMLAKLALHVKNFGERVKGLHLVSNKGFKIRLADGGQECPTGSICFSALHPDEVAAIKSAVASQVPGVDVDSAANISHLNCSTMGLGSHRPFASYALSTMLRQRYGNATLRLEEAFCALCDELYRLATDEVSPSDFTDLLQRCGITREKFAAFIEAVRPTEKFAQMSAEVLRKVDDIWPYPRVQDLRLALRSLEMDRLSLQDVLLAAVMKRASTVAADRSVQHQSFVAHLEHIAADIRLTFPTFEQSRLPEYLHAIAGCAIYDA